MKKIFTWLLLMTKRQLKHISTIIILVGMLIAVISISFLPTTIQPAIHVGYYIDKNNPHYLELSDSLDTHDGCLIFTVYDDIEELEALVISGTLQAGYVFNEDLAKVSTFRTADNASAILSDVVILAMIMEQTADDMLVKDILRQSFFADMTDEDVKRIYDIYETYATNGSTFAFDYRALYDAYEGSTRNMDISSYITTPVRGIIATFIFIATLAAGANSYIDEASHIYANIPLRRRPALRLLNLSIPAILSGIIGFIGILLVGISNNIFYEVYALLAYTGLCIAFCFLLTFILNKYIYLSLIPVFILGSIVCCPIFFNLGNIIPAMKIIQQMFLPTYYVTTFF